MRAAKSDNHRDAVLLEQRERNKRSGALQVPRRKGRNKETKMKAPTGKNKTKQNADLSIYPTHPNTPLT